LGDCRRLCTTQRERDLDIVIAIKPSVLDRLIRSWHWYNDAYVTLAQTAFGGYRLSSDAWELDLWAAESTVSVAKGLVIDSNIFRAVARSAALSLDSIVITSRGTLYEDGFFDTIRTGVLRLNHCLLERPNKVAEKALRLCERFRVVPDLDLQTLIAKFVGSRSIERLYEARPFGYCQLHTVAASIDGGEDGTRNVS